MTDFEIPKEVRDACELAQHEIIVDQIQQALHKVAVLQKKIGVKYIDLLHQPSGRVEIRFKQEDGLRVLGHVDPISHRFTGVERPSPPRPYDDLPIP